MHHYTRHDLYLVPEKDCDLRLLRPAKSWQFIKTVECFVMFCAPLKLGMVDGTELQGAEGDSPTLGQRQWYVV